MKGKIYKTEKGWYVKDNKGWEYLLHMDNKPENEDPHYHIWIEESKRFEGMDVNFDIVNGQAYLIGNI